MKLLIAYDGSDHANAAIDGLRYAGLPADTQVAVLTVGDFWPGLLESRAHAVATAGPERTRAQRVMDEAVHAAHAAKDRLTALFPGWVVNTVTAAGSPANTIVRRADELRPDLLLLGSRGRNAVVRALLGSVSMSVLHHAHCAVRVGRAAVGDRPPGPPRLLVGVDGSDGSLAAVATVAGRTWAEAPLVRLINALDLWAMQSVFTAPDVPVAAPSLALPIDDHLRRAHELLEQAAGTLRAAGLAVTTAVRDGSPAHALAAEAEQFHADAIVVGAKGLNAFERMVIGSTSSSLAANAPCSVEIVRG